MLSLSTLFSLFQYLARIEAAPFRKKEGTLETSDVFNYGDVNEDNEVSITEKNNQFKITFGLYEIDGDWHKSSAFKFECYSNIFVPTNYPAQLCGSVPFVLLVPLVPRAGTEISSLHRALSVTRPG